MVRRLQWQQWLLLQDRQVASSDELVTGAVGRRQTMSACVGKVQYTNGSASAALDTFCRSETNRFYTRRLLTAVRCNA